ncbi:MAG: glycosyltransferase family 39 protein [Candidatus Shapirobacteria bacterium]
MKRLLKNTSFILFIIFLISAAFRFYKLANYPVSLSIDEIIIGYDSYSLLKTGKDHWGEAFPLAFQSIGDYKPPVLVYLMVPAIKFLGLNELGIRFTIALFGSLTPLLAYFLINLLIKNRNIALISAFLLAISPWHINFSRSTFEAILALLLMLAGVLVFLKSKNGKLWWFSGLLFSLSIYSYHAERVFVPLFLIALLVIFFDRIKKNSKNALLAIVISLIFLLPFFQLMFSPKGQTRAKTGIFLNDYEFATVKMSKVEQKGATEIDRVLANKGVQALSFWAKRYLEYSDLDYLFFGGMGYTHEKYPDIGVMHYFELGFFIWGLIAIIGKGVKISGQNKKLIFVWLLLGPIPATLANNSQHPLRSLTAIPIPQLISAIGIYQFFGWVKNLKKCIFKFLTLLLFFGAVLASLVYYVFIYYVHYPVHYSHYIMYGMKEIALYTWENRDKYDRIIIDGEFGIEDKNIAGIPFAYVLTHNKVDPFVIQQARQEGKDPLSFENFTFRGVNWPEDSQLKKTLLVASAWQLPPQDISQDQIVKVVSLYNGQPMFYLVETDAQ